MTDTNRRMAFWIVTVAMIAGGAMALTFTPARPQDRPLEVDLQLVLAADVSNSMKPVEIELQRAGYVAALSSPELAKAVSSGALGRVAIAYMEWSESQNTVVPWTIVADAVSAAAFARRIQEYGGTGTYGATAIGDAMIYARVLFDESPYTSFRRVIDLSGDGKSNKGSPPGLIREAMVAEGITVNAVVVTKQSSMSDDPPEEIVDYYQSEVIGGPGAFVLHAEGYADFPEALARKLVLEIAGAAVPPLRTAAADMGIPISDSARQARCAPPWPVSPAR